MNTTKLIILKKSIILYNGIIVAGELNYPAIDWNGLEDSFGIMNINRIVVGAQNYAIENSKTDMSCLTKIKTAWEVGFKTAQEYYQNLEIMQKDFNIEIETQLQVRHGIEWHDLPNQDSGNDPEGIYRRIPKITDNKIKILKKL